MLADGVAAAAGTSGEQQQDTGLGTAGVAGVGLASVLIVLLLGAGAGMIYKSRQMAQQQQEGLYLKTATCDTPTSSDVEMAGRHPFKSTFSQYS
jgi:uncharacterized protein HemX